MKIILVMKASNGIFALFFVLLLLGTQALQAQERPLFEAPAEEISLLPKTDFGFLMGTSFSTGFMGSSLFSQSLAPHFQWNPSQRFSLVAGAVFSAGQLSGNAAMMPFSPFFGSTAAETMPRGLFSNTVYAFGAYKVNPRLTITGGSWMENNNFQTFPPQMNDQAFNLNARGMMMGFDYKISENFRFGAQLNVSQGYNPYSPLSPMGGMNPGFFAPSPFPRNTIR